MINQCKHCGKLDYDDPGGCYKPVIHTPAIGDWLCRFKVKKPVVLYHIKNQSGYWLSGARGYTQNKSEAGAFTLTSMKHLAISGCILEQVKPHDSGKPLPTR